MNSKLSAPNILLFIFLWNILYANIQHQNDTILKTKSDSLQPVKDSILLKTDTVKSINDSLQTQSKVSKSEFSSEENTKSQKDTLQSFVNDTVEPGKDTSLIRKDTLKKEVKAIDTLSKEIDTIKISTDTIKPKKDTVQIAKDTLTGIQDSTLIHDQVKGTIAISKADSITEKQAIPVLETKTDSALYFVYQYFIKDTAETFSDTLKTHVNNILHHIKYPEIDSSINYVSSFLSKDTLAIQKKDSFKYSLQDTKYNYLHYLLDSADTDSVRFLVITRKHDTVPLWLKKEHAKDSSRLILYDDLENPAGLWLIPKNDNSIKIKLDESTVIEKTDFQRTRENEIPTLIDVSELQDYEPPEMIFAQWKMGGVANLNFSQGYVKNWVKGGENNLTSLLDVKYHVNYTKGKTKWENDAEYKFGLLQSGEKGLRKNEDLLEINSKFGSNARKNWYYSALVNFTTQLFKGYDYPNDSVAVSGLLSPSYLVFSVGMDYNPNNDFTLLLSPISSKFTMIRDTTKFDQTKYGIPQDKKTRKEVGAYIKSIYSFQVKDNIHVQNKINLFTNYIDDPQNIDIDWEITVNMKVTELIQTTISTHLIYDENVSRYIQFKEMLSVGLKYQF